MKNKKKDELIYPKVLIISHNLYDESNNIGKTLISLFKDWPKDKLAQIYFRNEVPSFDFCDEYYCITDQDVLKSAIAFKHIKAGYILKKTNNNQISNIEKEMYKVGNQRKPFISLMRDFTWDHANWKTELLVSWLSHIAPDIILFVPNDYCLAYNVLLFVEKILNIPLIPFYMDDSFYFGCEKNNWIDKIRRKRLRCLANKGHQNCKMIFTICEKMSKEYEKQFHLPCESYMNSVEIKKTITQLDTIKKHGKIIITYLGNLHSNRWKSIIEIAECVEKIDDYNVILRIFSASELERKTRKVFDQFSCIDFRGRIESTEVKRFQRQSDILLHVESFDLKSKNSTKLSLSTKIPEYLSVGVPIFAYGPSDIASIQYLKENNCAQVCMDKSELFYKLLDIIKSQKLRIQMAENGLEIARKNHDIKKNSVRFQKKILELEERTNE